MKIPLIELLLYSWALNYLQFETHERYSEARMHECEYFHNSKKNT